MRAVIASVNYADFLAVTLPAWRAVLPQADLCVVTAPEDEATRRVVSETLGVSCHLTDAWTRPGPLANPRGARPAVFNKALALDEAFGFVPDGVAPPKGELCLSLDADVYPRGSFADEATIAADTLYGCPRYLCMTRTDLQGVLEGRKVKLPLIPPRGKTPRPWSPTEAALKRLGYFQLFRYAPGFRFGSYWNAAQYDKEARGKFRHRGVVNGFSVLHLGECNQANWSGRVIGPWR